MKALHDRGVVVWVSEDTIPTAEEARAEFVDPSRAVLALLVSERTSQTIVFNDALFQLIDDEIEGAYPAIAPLRVGDVELPDALSRLNPVSLDASSVERVADLLATVVRPDRAWKQIAAASAPRGKASRRTLRHF